MKKLLTGCLLLFCSFKLFGQEVTDSRVLRSIHAFARSFQNDINSMNAIFSDEGQGPRMESLKSELRGKYFYQENTLYNVLNEENKPIDVNSFFDVLIENYTSLERKTYQNPIYCTINEVQRLKSPFLLNGNPICIDFFIIENAPNLQLKILKIAMSCDDVLCKNEENPPIPHKDSDGDGIIDARDECPDTKEGDEVDNLGCSLDDDDDEEDSDSDGVPNINDKCPNTPKAVRVDQDGCPIRPPDNWNDSDGDGILDGVDLCPNTPAGPDSCYNHWKNKMVKRITTYGCIDCDHDGKSPDHESLFFFDENDDDRCITNTFCNLYSDNPYEPDSALIDSLISVIKNDSILLVEKDTTISELEEENKKLNSKLDCFKEFIEDYKSDDAITIRLQSIFAFIEEVRKDELNPSIPKSTIERKYSKRLAEVFRDLQKKSSAPILLNCDGVILRLEMNRLTLVQSLMAARMMARNWANVTSYLDAQNDESVDRNNQILFIMKNLSNALSKNPNYEQNQEIQMLMFDLFTTTQLEKKDFASRGKGTAEADKSMILIQSLYKKDDFYGVIREYAKIKNHLDNPSLKDDLLLNLQTKFNVSKTLILDRGDISKIVNFIPPGTQIYELIENRMGLGKNMIEELLSKEKELKESKYVKLLSEVKKFKSKYLQSNGK